MSQTTAAKSAPTAILQKIQRLGRFLLFLLTAGWLFPHTCTEDMDLTQIQNGHMAKQPKTE